MPAGQVTVPLLSRLPRLKLARPRTYPQHTPPLLPLLRSRPGGVHKASVVRSPGSDNPSDGGIRISDCGIKEHAKHFTRPFFKSATCNPQSAILTSAGKAFARGKAANAGAHQCRRFSQRPG